MLESLQFSHYYIRTSKPDLGMWFQVSASTTRQNRRILEWLLVPVHYCLQSRVHIVTIVDVSKWRINQLHQNITARTNDKCSFFMIPHSVCIIYFLVDNTEISAHKISLRTKFKFTNRFKTFWIICSQAERYTEKHLVSADSHSRGIQ